MKLWAVLIVVTIIVVPFSNILHFIFPVSNILGKSAWVVVPTVTIIAIYLSSFLNNLKAGRLPRFDFFVVTMIVISVLIHWLRSLIHNEEQSYFDLRYIATSFIYLMIARRMVSNLIILKVLAWALIIQGLLVALLVIINFHIYPTLSLDFDTTGTLGIIFDGLESRNRLLNASISANQILCSIFVLSALVKKGFLNKDYFLILAGQLFMLYAISLGESRFPMAVAISIIIIIFLLRLHVYAIVCILTFGLLVSTYLVLTSQFENILHLGRGFGGRPEKLRLSLQILTESSLNFIFGSSQFEASNSVSDGGIGISDNSYMHVSLSLGLPFAVIYFSSLLNFIRIRITDNLSLFFLSYLIINFGLTNCILWESWLCIALFSGVVITKLGQIGKTEQLRI